MLKEFRDFAVRGNVVDLAVGVIIGASFGKIVDALVNKVIMPPIGFLTGGLDFSKLMFTLQTDKPETADINEAVNIEYGVLITTVIQFIILAFVIFMLVKAVSKWKAQMDAAGAPPPPTEVLLTEIRDLLKK